MDGINNTINAAASAMLSAKNSILTACDKNAVIPAAVKAAGSSNAKDLLVILPMAMKDAAMAQLAGMGATPAGTALKDRPGGAGADLCRAALRRQDAAPPGGPLRVWLVSAGQSASIGAWYGEWGHALRDGCPFGFLLAFDAPSFLNARSGRGRALRLMADYAKHAALCWDGPVCGSITNLARDFGAAVCPVPGSRVP